MINRILRIIFKYLEMFDNEKFQYGYRIINGKHMVEDPAEEFVIIKKKIMRFTNFIILDCFHLFNAIITLIIFLILWKYDIQLVSMEVIIAYKYLLYYYFIFIVIKIVIKLLQGLTDYILYNNDWKLRDVFSILIRFVSFIINCYIIMWLCNINFFELLQYNVIFIITNINIIIYGLHLWWMEGKIKGKDFTNFVSYPWIIILLVYILVWMNIQEGFKVTHIIKEYCRWEISPKETK